MEENRPGYYAVIPADVRYDDRLTPNAKLFYAEITSLARQEGFCFAANDYFMQVYGFSDRTVTRLISQLEEYGYIIRHVLKDKEGKVAQRRLYLKASVPDGLPPDKIDGNRQNCHHPPDKIGGDNNINNNTKKESKKKKPKAEPLTDEQLQKIFSDWIAEIAPESWSREVKNRLWKALCDFYSPRTLAKNNPERSTAGVNALKRQLLDYSEGYPEKMCMILDTALSRGYRGIIPLNEAPQKQIPKSAGEENTRWL